MYSGEVYGIVDFYIAETLTNHRVSDMKLIDGERKEKETGFC